MEIKLLNSRYFLTMPEEYPCPYFKDGRICRVEFTFPLERSTNIYEWLLREGYRRSSSVFYRNICPGCRECIPIRLKPEFFKLSKSQRRNIASNWDIKIEYTLSSINETKKKIFEKYISEIHQRPVEPSLQNEMEHIHYGFDTTLEMDYYLEGRLVGVGIVDVSEHSLSSVYFYYDPDVRKKALGVFSIIKEIETCKKLKKEYYYLGYYIASVKKMSYKKAFRPYELLIDGKWLQGQ